MTGFAELKSERGARGISLDEAAAATSIRRPYLDALERGDLEALPGDAYARGYLRTYAAYLRLDPEPLLGRMPAAGRQRAAKLSIRPLSPLPPARLALTVPLASGVGLALAATLLTAYAAYEIAGVRGEVAPQPTPVASVPLVSPPAVEPSAGPTAAPAAVPTPAPTVAAVRLVSVSIEATDDVWIAVDVDGKAVYPDSGRVLPRSGTAMFVGQRVRITSGKGAATMVTIDGAPIGPLGSGVVTREFTAHT